MGSGISRDSISFFSSIPGAVGTVDGSYVIINIFWKQSSPIASWKLTTFFFSAGKMSLLPTINTAVYPMKPKAANAKRREVFRWKTSANLDLEDDI